MKYTLGFAPWSRSARAIATALSVTDGSGNRVKHKYESGSQPFEPQSRLTRSPSPPAPVLPGTRLAVPTRRPTRIGREGAIHRVEIAADDSRVEVRGRDFRIASEQAHRRVLGADVIGSAAHVMIGAGVVEEARDRLVERRAALAVADAVRQVCFSVVQPSSPNSRASASCTSRRVGEVDASGQRANEPSARVASCARMRFQPALGFLLEAVEREIGRDWSRHDLPPKLPEVR